jgi:hypothetical protein
VFEKYNTMFQKFHLVLSSVKQAEEAPVKIELFSVLGRDRKRFILESQNEKGSPLLHHPSTLLTLRLRSKKTSYFYGTGYILYPYF